jgi:hypothetical protein
MSNIDFCHLGDDCAPGIIIDDILNYNKKCLFMLGFYDFNNILLCLNDNHLEKIYNKDNLVVLDNDNVYHNYYHFTFNHDYKCENSNITNYDFIRERFYLKIQNFRSMLYSDNICIFITFTQNIDNLKINDMLNWLSCNKKNFHLMIFTHNNFSTQISSNNLSIIKLENSFNEWYFMEYHTKFKVYQEIYNNFIRCLDTNNISNNFPKNLEDTNFCK